MTWFREKLLVIIIPISLFSPGTHAFAILGDRTAFNTAVCPRVMNEKIKVTFNKENYKYYYWFIHFNFVHSCLSFNWDILKYV